MVAWIRAIYPVGPLPPVATVPSADEGQFNSHDDSRRSFLLGAVAHGLIHRTRDSFVRPPSPSAPGTRVQLRDGKREQADRLNALLQRLHHWNLANLWSHAVGTQWLPTTAPYHTHPGARLRHPSVEHPAPLPEPPAPEIQFHPPQTANPAAALASRLKVQASPLPRDATGPIPTPTSRKLKNRGRRS